MAVRPNPNTVADFMDLAHPDVLQQRELCDLRYRAELPNGRIAELTGLNPTTVAKSLQRIREQLRECIESRAREAGDGSLASPSGGGS